MNEESARRVPGLARSLRWAKRVAAGCMLALFVDWVIGSIVVRLAPRGHTHKTLDVMIAGTLTLGVALLVVTLVSGLVAIILQTRLRHILQEAKGMLCPGCGYNLSGVISGLCPECGREYHGATVAAEWQDEYATALPPWSPLDPAPRHEAPAEKEGRD